MAIAGSRIVADFRVKCQRCHSVLCETTWLGMPTEAAPALLSVLDWTVIVAYVGGLVVLGLLMSRRHFGPVVFSSRRGRPSGR